MNLLGNFTNQMNKWCVRVGMVLLIVVILAAFLQVMTRNVFHMGAPWTEELARIGFNWMCMMGAGTCIAEFSNPVMSMLQDSLGKGGRKKHSLLTHIAITVLMGVIAFAGFSMLNKVSIQTSPHLGINFKYLYASIPVGAIFVGINAINVIVGLSIGFKTGREEEKIDE